jgi:hypothetical protein
VTRCPQRRLADPGQDLTRSSGLRFRTTASLRNWAGVAWEFAISKILMHENGHTVPAVETLEKFARALEVPMYVLFYDGDEPNSR